MKAALLEKPGRGLVVRELESPRPGRGEVLIRVRACGVCHTDLHIAAGEWPLKRLPLILGHEVVGEVAGLGEGVTQHREGDRVGVSWLYYTCGHCEFCSTDRERFCPEYRATGYMADGGFAEYMVAPATHAIPVPPELGTREAAPLFCAGLTAYRAVKTSEIRVGETVAVWGAGGLGQCAVQIAKAMGARVVAVDVSEQKLAQAQTLGADVAVSAAEGKAAEAIQSAGGAHAVLCFAPSAEAVVQAFEALRPCGTIVLVGLPPGEFSLPIVGCVRKGIRILTTAIGTRQDLRAVLALAAAEKIRTTTEGCRLEEINAVLDRLARGEVVGRMVIEFD
jgi:propanol-preferring alcohol dehydrogenase